MMVYLNGRLLPEQKAHISIHDHGFLYGDGVYETMRVYDGCVFLLEGHLKRLQHSATGIHLKWPLSFKKMGEAIQKTIRANKLKEAVVRLTLTRGPGEYGFNPAFCKQPTLAIVARRFDPYPPSYHKEGIVVAVVSIRRNSPDTLPPHVKSTSCMNGVLAKIESLKMGAQEGIFLTLKGALAEGTVSNIFLVFGNRLLTPLLDGHLLAGVTRDYVCRLARSLGYQVREQKVLVSDLSRADEIFLTNTTMEVLPVRKIVMGKQKSLVKSVGPVTRHLMRVFKATNAKLDRLSTRVGEYKG